LAGFLDASTTVLDVVLTDLGRSLLLKGDLHFEFYQVFDDEVDYQPQTSELRADQSVSERRQELTESPLVREATTGYRGLNFAEEDTTNVHRPMYSGPPGIGQTTPLPQLLLNRRLGDLVGGEFVPAEDDTIPLFLPSLLGGVGEARYEPVSLSVSQKKLSKLYVQKDASGQNILKQVGPTPGGFQRLGSAEVVLEASYSTGSFPPEYQPEGFLVTMFVSSALQTDELGQVQGGFQEVVHNRDSAGSIVYRNDIKLKVFTP
jgi:hypothetical protein